MVTIQLLGGFKISQEGELLPTPLRPRGRSLLVYLLLHHATPQDRAHLAYTFWPETSDRQARTNLRRELHQLRQTLPLFHTLIRSDNQSVQGQSEPAVRLDIARRQQAKSFELRATMSLCAMGKAVKFAARCNICAVAKFAVFVIGRRSLLI